MQFSLSSTLSYMTLFILSSPLSSLPHSLLCHLPLLLLLSSLLSTVISLSFSPLLPSLHCHLYLLLSSHLISSLHCHLSLLLSSPLFSPLSSPTPSLISSLLCHLSLILSSLLSTVTCQCCSLLRGSSKSINNISLCEGIHTGSHFVTKDQGWILQKSSAAHKEWKRGKEKRKGRK